LGIPKNSNSEPDFLGWEVKQHKVSNFAHPFSGGAITLMTPEPTGGFYVENGVEAFVRRFGYPDRLGRRDRFNFGGIHSVGKSQSLTGLEMILKGYNTKKDVITDTNGAIMLVNKVGEVAASWSFSGLLAHWSRKHTRAVYVPCIPREKPYWQYSYGSLVRLGLQTDSLMLLKALATGIVYYDPGIKLEQASSHPKTKRRSQFRIASKNINVLYKTVEVVEV
jgi:hypothetical protein